MHRMGPVIWGGIALPGSAEMMMKGNGFGFNWRGLYVTSMIEAHSNWKNYADEFPDSVKLAMLVGEYMNRHYRGYHYAKSQNLSRRLRAAYDAVLDECDLLLMPTNPMKATPIPPADAPRELNLQRAFEMVVNTPAFDATGHPAMSVPCGMSDGLPIGMMLVARQYEESKIYQAASAFEKAFDWKTL
jgi:amidase